ncbi:predicted arabinose efflux permease, MFS family [Nitrosomonas sp. PY1]|nr:predicted arabinose efflux permease, MFS family [Nitrosomonas sp. PY1]
MTDLSSSPVMVSLVQVATSLPVVMFALIAGALTDTIDHRRYLICTQIWMMLAAAMLAVLTATGQLNAWSLLILTFALGLGTAMAMPALSAAIADLVPRNLLSQAIALNSLSMNLSRSIGPAIGGLLLAQLGAWAAYGVNMISFIGMTIMLWYWRRLPDEHALPPERFFQALRAGLRYSWMASSFRAVLIRATAFIVFASSVWALLPLIARHELAGNPGTYGFLLTSVGVGAVITAITLPRIYKHTTRDRLVFIATIVYALTTLAIATIRNDVLLYIIMAVCGAAWLSVLSSLQVAAQISVPAWVRGRALSLYIMIFFTGMTFGSLLWGKVAAQTNTPVALLISAAGAVIAALIVRKFSLGPQETPDLTPSYHWPHPSIAKEPDKNRGPVLVTIEYEIVLDQRKDFLRAINSLGIIRRRDGAFAWGVFEDLAVPGRYIEIFQVSSWLDHLRQHARITREDQRIQEVVNSFHIGETVPKVSHFAGGAPVSPVSYDSIMTNS